ncbi:unnamed protein product [Gongylonema pulchrum]|uniref:Lipoprotein n=1 Tax=Gongylonema pulchrum TaxID=637853 RepID=A0A183D741_9BILA|nr:unnamed protein product [Gongylonema pulchrum]
MVVFQLSAEQTLRHFCLITALLTVALHGCDVEVRLRSDTTKPFQFQVSAESAGFSSDRVTVTGKTIERPKAKGGNVNYHVFHVSFYFVCYIKAPNCNKKYWQFFLWKLAPGSSLSAPKWQVAHHIQGKAETLPLKSLLKWQPYMDITIKDDLKFHLGPRLGVIWCDFC